MAKYLIHACNKRMWYVDKYLIPSMMKQNISISDIGVWLDSENDGCLRSCMKCFNSLNDEGYTWHLQDDILIARDFYERCSEYDNVDIICGFCSNVDVNKDNWGFVSVDDMWYSFPCIRIPNKIAKECAEWYYSELKRNATDIKFYDRINKHDDLIFRAFITFYYPDLKVLLVKPNLVNHIDYLIGGTVVNFQRPEQKIVSAHWNDDELIKNLECQLKQ